MEVYTLEIAQNHLSAWLKAELAVSTGQSYKIGARSLERANLGEIRKQIQYWSNEVERISRGQKRGIRARQVIPRD